MSLTYEVRGSDGLAQIRCLKLLRGALHKSRGTKSAPQHHEIQNLVC